MIHSLSNMICIKLYNTNNDTAYSASTYNACKNKLHYHLTCHIWPPDLLEYILKILHLSDSVC